MKSINNPGHPPSTELMLVSLVFAQPAPRTAARILSAVKAFHANKMNPGMDPILAPDLERALQETRARMGETEFQLAREQGAGLSLREACDLALSALKEL